MQLSCSANLCSSSFPRPQKSTGAGSLLCVTDANIWIDLYRGGLAENAFKLPLDLVAPDVIIEELQVPEGDLLVSSGLRVQELSGSQVLTVLDFAERYARPSRQDLFALVLARDFNAVLLTGDASLRDAAENEGVRVHGVIWLLDLMVGHGIINTRDRATSLKLMLRCGSRLPCDEVRARLDEV